MDEIPTLIDRASPAVIRTTIALSSISYNIERIGDNATNIAEEAAIYNAEGLRRKAPPNKTKN